MIVIDATAMVEALVGSQVDAELIARVSGELAAPHLLDVEVLSALRGLTLGGVLPDASADLAREDYTALTIHRYDVLPLAERIWSLRHQFTSYDASYLALAETLDVPLVTCDAKLAAGGHHAQVLVFDSD